MDHDADLDAHIAAYARHEADDVNINTHIQTYIGTSGGKWQRFNPGRGVRTSESSSTTQSHFVQKWTAVMLAPI